MKTLIYICSPYSHPDKFVRNNRFVAVCEKAAELIRAGILVFSPIAHSHCVEVYGNIGTTDYDDWREFDERMIEACDELWVLKLDGWQESKGVAEEIKFAEREGKPIVYVEV